MILNWAFLFLATVFAASFERDEMLEAIQSGSIYENRPLLQQALSPENKLKWSFNIDSDTTFEAIKNAVKTKAVDPIQYETWFKMQNDDVRTMVFNEPIFARITQASHELPNPKVETVYEKVMNSCSRIVDAVNPWMKRGLNSENKNWMKEYSDKTLFELTIPGSYNSAGSKIVSTNVLDLGRVVPLMVRQLYDTSNELYENHLVRNMPKKLQPYLRKRMMDIALKHILEPVAVCQTLSIKDQLTIGVRYLDVRIVMRDGVVWANQGFDHIPFKNIIKDVNEFVTENPSEIVMIGVKATYDEKIHATVKIDYKSVNEDLQLIREKLVPAKDISKPISELTSQGMNVVVINHSDNAHLPTEEEKVLGASFMDDKWYNHKTPKELYDMITDIDHHDVKKGKEDKVFTCIGNACSPVISKVAYKILDGKTKGAFSSSLEMEKRCQKSIGAAGNQMFCQNYLGVFNPWYNIFSIPFAEPQYVDAIIHQNYLQKQKALKEQQ